MRRKAELAVSLLCRGVRLDPSCELEADGRSVVKRRAGLGSGLEMIVPAGKKIWINVPVEESFVGDSPYLLVKRGGDYYVCGNEGGPTRVFIPAAPHWYNSRTQSDTLMSRVGVLQGTCLGIYVGKRCAFWQKTPSMACHFCATGINVGVHEESEKSAADVVEVARTARAESGTTFVHLNSGYQEGDDLSLMLPLVKALKEDVGTLVGVQCIPPENPEDYRPLIETGADHFSVCYELHDPGCFERYLPGKAKYIGQCRFFRALEYLAHNMPRGSVSGEIIAGLEPRESTCKAIDYITSLGAFPTVCIFRPLKGTALEHRPPPGEKDMAAVLSYAAQKCLERRIPMGMAPNLEVSLVLTPDDARYLLPRNISWYWHHLRLRAMKAAARPYFFYKMRRK